MSWQRILAFARQRGIPLIVTDVAGREPLVILPFSEYEQLSEIEADLETQEFKPFSHEPTVVGPVTAIHASTVKNENEDEEVDLQDIIRSMPEDMPRMTDMPVEKIQTQNPISSSSLSLEEQFYLEPLDDEENSA